MRRPPGALPICLDALQSVMCSTPPEDRAVLQAQSLLQSTRTSIAPGGYRVGILRTATCATAAKVPVRTVRTSPFLEIWVCSVLGVGRITVTRHGSADSAGPRSGPPARSAEGLQRPKASFATTVGHLFPSPGKGKPRRPDPTCSPPAPPIAITSARSHPHRHWKVSANKSRYFART